MFSRRFENLGWAALVMVTAAGFSLAQNAAAAEGRPAAHIISEDQPENAWREGLREGLFDSADITDDTRRIVIDAPYRAEDAAIVPITLTIAPELAAKSKKLTLIVDENPMPVAGEFTFGPAAAKGERYLSTRLRINTYSFVRVVVETTDGGFFMNKAFVKAAGGCSAPAGKDEDAARASLGKMKIRQLRARKDDTALGQLMIKHPQYSGFQMNQLTGYFRPAEYVSDITVKRGDDVVFTMTGGISISEDPHFRFTYDDNGRDPLTVEAKDIEDRHFKASSRSGVARHQG